ncbi:MAG TPA: hypothetical protein VMH39_05285 [Gemmatimonadaceae bacterium]|nr:hypothetical protein [Gemmatimonadaceae bacterium]
MSGYFALDPRALTPEDAPGARVLLIGTLGVTPYVDRAIEILELAERGQGPEYQALVVARDATVAALALFGSIAGTAGGTRLYTIALDPTVVGSDIGRRLLAAVAAKAAADGRRYVLVELADDPAIGTQATLLREAGYAEEARVPDFYRDGVALIFMRLVLHPA